MKQEETNKKEMNYVTNSSHPFENQAPYPGEKMESGTVYFRSNSYYSADRTSYTDGEHSLAEYIAEDISYMADYEFSENGDILAVHYTPVSASQASWHRNL